MEVHKIRIFPSKCCLETLRAPQVGGSSVMQESLVGPPAGILSPNTTCRLEPAPQGMGAPQASRERSGNARCSTQPLHDDAGQDLDPDRGATNGVRHNTLHQIRPPWGSGTRITTTESGGGCRWHDRMRLLTKVFLSTWSNHSPTQHNKSRVPYLGGHILGPT